MVWLEAGGVTVNWLKRSYRHILSAWIAFVFLQSLFFKFTGSYETQHIFGTLGAWAGLEWFAQHGGIAVGIVELIAALMLFSPWRAWGALLAFMVMSGAVFFHLFTPLGIQMPVFNGEGIVTGTDGGTLFIMACITWLSAVGLLVSDGLSQQSQLLRVFGKGI